MARRRAEQSRAEKADILTLNSQDHNLANTLIDEFPCRPHWTKNTREVFARSVKNLDPSVSAPASYKSPSSDSVQHLARFKAVRERFDPEGIYRSVVGEILGFY